MWLHSSAADLPQQLVCGGERERARERESERASERERGEVPARNSFAFFPKSSPYLRLTFFTQLMVFLEEQFLFFKFLNFNVA